MNQDKLFAQFNDVALSNGWKVQKDLFPESIPSEVFPNPKDIFNVFGEISIHDVRYVIVGQDPYYTTRSDLEGAPHAIGIAFAVDRNCKDIPHSLLNIAKYVYGVDPKSSKPRSHDLANWMSKKGVLLINAALTVPIPITGENARNVAGKHVPIWREFTKCIINQIRGRIEDRCFIAWGCDAREILDDVFRPFSWSYHPSVPSYGEEFSFKNFWEGENSDIGNNLKMDIAPN